MDFSNRLSLWYLKNKRDLPWRETNDPYFIWLSEIILQQTRVNQGLNYYLKFIKNYPDIFSLASASRDEVFKLWQGLGYYNRADNLLATAKIITEQHSGQFPNDHEALLELPGIGPYTSAAIASMAFNVSVPVIDGNVYRVLSRIFGITEAINSTEGKKEFNRFANELIDRKEPGIYNQAIMEFGALHCKPSNPDCNNCIFNSDCYAYAKGLVKELPVKIPKKKARKRYFYYFMIHFINNNSKGKVYLKKRVNGDIWKNLYDFLLVESKKKVILNDTKITETLWKEFGIEDPEIKHVSKEYVHKLTHQTIHARFIIVKVAKKLNTSEKFVILADEKKLVNYPVPRLIEQFLTDYKIL